MQAVVGTPEENSFVKLVRQETAEFRRLVESLKQRCFAAASCRGR
jgi:hypothetical protein